MEGGTMEYRSGAESACDASPGPTLSSLRSLASLAFALLLHHGDLAGLGIVIQLRAVRHRGNGGEVLFGHELVEVLGITTLLDVELLDGLVEAGGVDRLDGPLFAFGDGTEVIYRGSEWTAAGGGVGAFGRAVGALATTNQPHTADQGQQNARFEIVAHEPTVGGRRLNF